MTDSYIEQLNTWYEKAELVTRANPPKAGDTIIYPASGGGYIIEVSPDDFDPALIHETGETARVLHRTPAPKPAWHSAIAVTADRAGAYAMAAREVYVNVGDGDWGSPYRVVDASLLIAPIPLIEAKATDAMIARFHHAAKAAGVRGLFPDELRSLLIATIEGEDVP